LGEIGGLGSDLGDMDFSFCFVIVVSSIIMFIVED
jgi:hypothetical protein